MASSNTANWPVYSRKRKANVEELSWWFQGPKYLQFALRATRTHLTPTSYQQSRQLFIRHKLARQSKIRELLSGKKKPQKQQLREEWRPLIDRDALRSVCQLQTPDGWNSRSSWLPEEVLQVQVYSCFSTREFWGRPQECSTSVMPEWRETVFNLHMNMGSLSLGWLNARLGFQRFVTDWRSFKPVWFWNPAFGTTKHQHLKMNLCPQTFSGMCDMLWFLISFSFMLKVTEWAHIYSTLFCDMIEAVGGFVTYLFHVQIGSQLLKHSESLISSCFPCCCGFCRSSVSILVPSSGQNADSIIYHVSNGD